MSNHYVLGIGHPYTRPGDQAQGAPTVGVLDAPTGQYAYLTGPQAPVAFGSNVFDARKVAPPFATFAPQALWQFQSADSLGVSRTSTADQRSAIVAAAQICADAGMAMRLPAHLDGGYRFSAAMDIPCPIFCDSTDESGALIPAVLVATTAANSALRPATGTFLYNVDLRQEAPVSRSSAFAAHGILLNGVDRVWVARCRVYGVAGAGYFVLGSQYCAFEDIGSYGTMADGFHNRPGPSRNTIQIHGSGYTAQGCGDDGLAFVSYSSGAPSPDPNRIKGCTWTDVTVLDGVNAGRGITVLGADDIEIRGYRVVRAFGSGVYVGADGGTNFTQGSNRVKILNGIVDECGNVASSTGSLHFRATALDPASNITIDNMSITNPRFGAVVAVATSGTNITNLTLRKVKINAGTQTAGRDGMTFNQVSGLNIDECDVEGVGGSGVLVNDTCDQVVITALTGRSVNGSRSASNDFVRFQTATTKNATFGSISLERQDTVLDRLVEVGAGWTISKITGTFRRSNVKEGVQANISGYSDPTGVSFIKTTYP